MQTNTIKNVDQSSSTILIQLQSACSDLKTLLQTSTDMETHLKKMDKRSDSLHQALIAASTSIVPLQSLSIAAKSLETRINRAVSPSICLIDGFKLAENLQRKLIDFSDELRTEKSPKKRLRILKKYVDCVDELNSAINSISQEGEPAIQKLQEVVEFLSRTKATDQYRTHRLRETLITLKALYETEVDAMRFDGLLDEALLNLQDEFESLLLQLKHQDIKEGNDEEIVTYDLANEFQVDVLKQIAETLAANDCVDICIDIFIKVRYRRAAKALMRLNPEYLRTYTPEQIDEMEWENLESSISLWIQHFQIAVKTVLVAEKHLSDQILCSIFHNSLSSHCSAKISDKIMAVFFRFGEAVARSNKEPQKLFKLLDMFQSLQSIKPEFSTVFEGEAGEDICTRFRELEKLLIHSSCKVFWEFGLQIECNQDGYPPPADGSVPKLVRYATNYLKFLTTETYCGLMGKVLQTEHVWKSGVLSKPELEEDLLREAIVNIMEAIQRNVETKRSRYRDNILSHVFAVNTYWYIYMRTRTSELGKLLGGQYMKKKYKAAAEEAAYLYQTQAWGTLIKLLDKEDLKRAKKDAIGSLVKEKMEAFMNGLNEITQKHMNSYSIRDLDLRDQIKDATLKLVVPTYREFVESYVSFVQVKSYLSPESIQVLLEQAFEGGDREQAGDVNSFGYRRGSNLRKSVGDSRDMGSFNRSNNSIASHA
ncbi:exocyst complex component EXO70I-like [Impatiens glandulifera]|uniref:exocyst complex component EXO70I-like n=1 Tax=Impatiens glandulifera TaxID=253017 RepID=UPI001FB129B7|nr:exocyst complex component EXO70I-like [Impatiens glandulifera]